MARISAVILTLNEERNIGRCLRSLEGVVEEVIVIDAFSKDKTEEICATHNVRFIQREWAGYSAARNFGIQQANYSYIFFVDADEALSEELRLHLLSIKGQLEGGYAVNRLTNYCGQWIRYGGWYPDRKLRLVPKGKANWDENVHVHEPLVLEKGTPMKVLKGDLLHYTCYTVSEHIERVHCYSSLGAKQWFEKGKKAYGYKLLFSPMMKFLKMYVLKRGFLDGYYGYIIARISAQAVFFRYAKLRELWANKEA